MVSENFEPEPKREQDQGGGSGEFAESDQDSDSIILLEYGDWDDLCSPEVGSHINRITIALQEDNDHEFMLLVTKGIEGEKTMEELGYEFSPYLLLWWAIECRALKCAQALLLRDTGLKLDLNFPLFVQCSEYIGLYPLHVVSQWFLTDFVKLFLSAGAATDLPCDIPQSPYYQMLPIHVVLEELREKFFWTPSLSVYVLILNLSKKTMVDPLSTVMWLLRYSPVEVTQDIIFTYAERGNVIELAVLLYVDCTYGLGNFASLSYEKFKALRLAVAEEIITLSEDGHFQHAQLGYWKFMERMVKKQQMICILELLEVFHRTNLQLCQSFDGLGGFVTVENVARRLVGAGFNLNGEYLHILEEMPTRGRNLLPDLHNSRALEKTLDNLPSFSQPLTLYKTMPIVRMLDNGHMTGFTRFFHGKQGFSTTARTFHTSGMYGTSMAATTMRGNQKKELRRPSFSFSKKWSVLALFIRRSLSA